MPSIEVSPTYFDVFGIRVERGRAFTPADADCVAAVCPAIVSREAARELWGGADPLGQRLRVDATHALVVVGVAADASSKIAEPVQALMVYTPWRPDARLYQPFLKVEDAESGVVRRVSSLVSERFAGAVAAPRTVEEELTLMTDAFQRIGEAGRRSWRRSRRCWRIVGVYGVVALAARRRLKEMGIRLALGARRMDVYRAMVAPNARPVATGTRGRRVVRDAVGGRVGPVAGAGVSGADRRSDRVRVGGLALAAPWRGDAGAGEAGDDGRSGGRAEAGITTPASPQATSVLCFSGSPAGVAGGIDVLRMRIGR